MQIYYKLKGKSKTYKYIHFKAKTNTELFINIFKNKPLNLIIMILRRIL